MKFWTSKQGQKITMDKRVELDFYLTGIPLIKGVEIPERINKIGDLKLKGIADRNPANIFARGLGNEGNMTREFQENAQKLFSNNINIDTYASNMQSAVIFYMDKYLESRGFRTNSLDDITKYPF